MAGVDDLRLLIMNKEVVETRYIPGSCNIGPVEIRRRFKIGFTGLGLMVLYIFLVEWLDFPHLFRLGLFLPAFYMVSGFIQAFGKFCYVYGWKGVASLSGRRKLKNITEQDSVKKDKNRAITFIILVVFSSVTITVIYFLLPV